MVRCRADLKPHDRFDVFDRLPVFILRSWVRKRQHSRIPSIEVNRPSRLPFEFVRDLGSEHGLQFRDDVMVALFG